MTPKLQNANFNLKFLIPLFLIVCYWFYLNICFGYFLFKIFYNFFDSIHDSSLSKRTKIMKKFYFKNIIKIIIDFCWKFIKNWFIRIGRKYLLFMNAMENLLKAVSIFLKKLKSLLKFKYNFRLLKKLLLVFLETFLTFYSLVDEVLFLSKLLYWIIEWRNLVRFLMKESVFITRIVYGLYLILLGIFGILLGFLLGLGMYGRKDEIDDRFVFFLLL